MKYELHATKPSNTKEEVKQIVSDQNLDIYSRIKLLAGALIEQKEEARKEYQALVHARNPADTPFAKVLVVRARDSMQRLNLWLPDITNEERRDTWLTIFPIGTWVIHFTFTLRKPYLSQDDTDFYIIDNPVKKEWVFKLPYVAPSQWKGSLRTAMMYQLVEEKNNLLDEKWVDRRLQLARLFGNEIEVGLDDKKFEAYLDRQSADEQLAQYYRKRLKEEYTSTGFLSGRLHFYPTFLDQIDLEVINPQDRQTGAGQQPIYFESVPQGATGAFTLLYVPLDRIGKDEAETRNQVAKDLRLVAEGLQAMFTLYGFGAKTSSGFGVAQENLMRQGQLQIKADISLSTTTEPAPTPPAPDLPRYLSVPNQLHADFQAEDGGLIPEAEYRKLIEGRGKKYTKPDKQLYAKAKGWLEREGQALAETKPTQEEPEQLIQTPIEQWSPQPFNSFSALVELAGRVAEALKVGAVK